MRWSRHELAEDQESCVQPGGRAALVVRDKARPAATDSPSVPPWSVMDGSYLRWPSRSRVASSSMRYRNSCSGGADWTPAAAQRTQA